MHMADVKATERCRVIVRDGALGNEAVKNKAVKNKAVGNRMDDRRGTNARESSHSDAAVIRCDSKNVACR